MGKFLLKLYISGQSSRSQRAIANLRRLCEGDLGGHGQLVVIDVRDLPELAEKEHILATPTLVKEQPAPARRVIGDLSDSARVLSGLDLHPLISAMNAREGRPIADEGNPSEEASPSS